MSISARFRSVASRSSRSLRSSSILALCFLCLCFLDFSRRWSPPASCSCRRLSLEEYCAEYRRRSLPESRRWLRSSSASLLGAGRICCSGSANDSSLPSKRPIAPRSALFASYMDSSTVRSSPLALALAAARLALPLGRLLPGVPREAHSVAERLAAPARPPPLAPASRRPAGRRLLLLEQVHVPWSRRIAPGARH